MNRAERLLEETPEMARIPEHIEALDLCAYETAQDMKSTVEMMASMEESACEQAQGESNEQKRRAKKRETLAASTDYQALQSERATLERLHVRLTARSARLRREHRATLLEVEIRQLGHRS